MALIAASEWATEQMPQMRDTMRLDILPAPSTHHGFEEARCFRHLPFHLIDFAIGGVDGDIAVPFDTRDMMHVDFNQFSHGFAPVCC